MSKASLHILLPQPGWLLLLKTQSKSLLAKVVCCRPGHHKAPLQHTAGCQLQASLSLGFRLRHMPHKLFGFVFAGGEGPDRACVPLTYSIRCIADWTDAAVAVQWPDFRWRSAWFFCGDEQMRVQAAVALVDDTTHKSAFPKEPSLQLRGRVCHCTRWRHHSSGFSRCSWQCQSLQAFQSCATDERLPRIKCYISCQMI